MNSTPLEKRTAGLELALEQTASFSEAILVVLKGVLERVQILDQAIEQNSAIAQSVPGILQAVSERLGALEDAVRKSAANEKLSEAAFKEFFERMNLLKASLPSLLFESTIPMLAPAQTANKSPSPLPPPPPVAAVPAAIDPAIPQTLAKVLERIAALEATIARLSAQTQAPVHNTLANAAIIDALRDSVKAVVERIGIIESSALRLMQMQKPLAPPPVNLGSNDMGPLQEAIGALAGRVRALEAQPEKIVTPVAPPVSTAVPRVAASDPAVAETLRKLTSRIEGLEHSGARQSFSAEAAEGAGNGNATLLAQASRLYPKSKTAIFVGTENFSDNIKYAFLAFHSFAAGKDMSASFLCHSPRQYEQLRAASLPSISPVPSDWTAEDARALISAKVAVLGGNFHAHTLPDPTAYALLQGAKFMQLWHGMPFKEIGLQNLFSTRGGNIFLADDLASCGPFDVMVAAAAVARREWERWFSFREFVPTGLPRTDIFFQNLTTQSRINADEKTLGIVEAAHGENKKVVLYAPTFRDHNPIWFEAAKLDVLASHCKERGWLLFVNLHPREQGAVEEMRAHYADINFVAPHTDIFPIAKFADCLVTDYSSLAFDFLYADRPVIFYRPDHADYTARARALVPNNQTLLTGPVADNVENLVAAVADVFDRPDMDIFRDARGLLRKKLFDYQDGKAGERFCTVLQRSLEPGIRFVPVLS